MPASVLEVLESFRYPIAQAISTVSFILNYANSIFSDTVQHTTDNIDSPFPTLFLPYLILSFNRLKLNKTFLALNNSIILRPQVIPTITLIKASYCSFKLIQLTPSLLQELT